MHRHFVSYPKSGRTWIRFILTRLDCEPSIHFHHDGFGFNDGSKPAHNFDLSERLQYYAGIEKLVCLERDPRDVMISLYHQITGRFRDFFEYSGTLSDFIRDEYFGAANLRRFRDMWQVIVEQRSYLNISYEACHKDMHSVIERLLSYYELTVSESKLSAAIEEGSFANMKRIEESGEFGRPWLQPRQNSPKVRQGKVGGFCEVLNETDLEFLNKTFGLSF
jgi:hypothetical protein